MGKDLLIAQPDDLSDIDIWMSLYFNTQITKKYSTAMGKGKDTAF